LSGGLTDGIGSLPHSPLRLLSCLLRGIRYLPGHLADGVGCSLRHLANLLRRPFGHVRRALGYLSDLLCRLAG
jgi:hypothetical protein